jgi:DtxR family Mn-dependent transcriptional regulator
MSVSKDDFLKTMYHLHYDESKTATPSELASRLSISNAAVTDMARKLFEDGLIEYEKYKPVSLTPSGLEWALRVIRKHRLWEAFLHEVLDLPFSELHREAEMLEHSTSDSLIEKIEEYLGFPEFDPHGDPIPTKQGILPSTDDMIRLTDCSPGVYMVSRLQHRNQGVSNFFASHDIDLNKVVELVEFIQDIGSAVIRINNEKLVIDHHISEQVFVKRLK